MTSGDPATGHSRPRDTRSASPEAASPTDEHELLRAPRVGFRIEPIQEGAPPPFPANPERSPVPQGGAGAGAGPTSPDPTAVPLPPLAFALQAGDLNGVSPLARLLAKNAWMGQVAVADFPHLLFLFAGAAAGLAWPEPTRKSAGGEPAGEKPADRDQLGFPASVNIDNGWDLRALVTRSTTGTAASKAFRIPLGPLRTLDLIWHLARAPTIASERGESPEVVGDLATAATCIGKILREAASVVGAEDPTRQELLARATWIAIASFADPKNGEAPAIVLSPGSSLAIALSRRAKAIVKAWEEHFPSVADDGVFEFCASHRVLGHDKAACAEKAEATTPASRTPDAQPGRGRRAGKGRRNPPAADKGTLEREDTGAATPDTRAKRNQPKGKGKDGTGARTRGRSAAAATGKTDEQ